ncbi:hypothetical protein SODG_006235 [Sodalis praecaptivus]
MRVLVYRQRIHFVSVCRRGVVLIVTDEFDDLEQGDQAGAGHDAMRQIMLVDIYAKQRRGISPKQETHAQHRQRPNIADKCGAQRRHREFKPGAHCADKYTHAQQCRLFTAFIAGLDGLSGGDTRRPCPAGRENARIEQPIQQPAVQQHCQRHANEHRHHQILPAEQPWDRNRQQQGVRRAKRGRRGGALGQILNVDGAKAQEAIEWNTRNNHRHHRANDGGIGRYPKRSDQLYADDRPKYAKRQQQQQGRGFKAARVRFLLGLLFPVGGGGWTHGCFSWY